MRPLANRRPTRLLLLCSFVFLSAPVVLASTVVELKLDEIVHPVSADYVVRGLERAKEINADAVLLVLNTPGGLDSSMRKIIDHIIHSPIPVIAYVSPSGARAASAGFFILLAADVAAMAPGTNSGAASPVLFGGPQVDETLKKKLTEDAAAYLRSFAAKRGRNVELAEKAVTEAKSFTDQEALKGNLIDLVAESPEVLLEKLHQRTLTRFDGRTQTLDLSAPRLEPVAMTDRERFLARILDPNIAFLLFIFGVLGLYIEFSNPGLILPGVAGGILLILAMFALHLLPINYAGVLLILLALVLFALEAKFISHGILALGGVAAMVLGSLMLVDAPIPEMRMKFGVIVPVALAFAAISVFLLRLVIKAFRQKVTTGSEEMVGSIGTVLTELAPEGQIAIHGEYWRARAGVRVPAGTRVRVVAMNGLTLTVEPAADTTAAAVGPANPSGQKE
ncbi:MAG: nodulation protein NfeD [Acidobacteria bacterium]|nr:nodulation protein NfeD [Acidobacteriota bacterium]